MESCKHVIAFAGKILPLDRPTICRNMAKNYPFLRDFPPVTPLEEVDRSDYVALYKARQQRTRERAIDLEEVKLLRDRVRECVRREEVNHPQRCREVVAQYMEAFKKYRSEGWHGKYSNP